MEINNNVKTAIIMFVALGLTGLFVKLQDDRMKELSRREIGVVDIAVIADTSRYIKDAEIKTKQDIDKFIAESVQEGKKVTTYEIVERRRKGMEPAADKAKETMKIVMEREKLIGIVGKENMLAGGKDVTQLVIAELDKDMPGVTNTDNKKASDISKTETDNKKVSSEMSSEAKDNKTVVEKNGKTDIVPDNGKQ